MGPLRGVRVVEMAGIGPAPFAGMMLADMGAEVLRIERPVPPMTVMSDPTLDVLNRGKRSVVLDLKSAAGVKAVLHLCRSADVLIEGFRPGVMERLSLGPEECWKENPRLVFGRVTGFGQTGPLANAAGHDINYVALSGALHAIGMRETPAIPLNLVADFGGGGMLLAFGALCAVIEASRSGKGQVVDATMIDGVGSLLAIFYGLMAMGVWQDERGVNVLDGAAHFYGVYETRDRKWISIGSIEPQFYAELLRRLGLEEDGFSPQFDAARWPELKKRLAALFRTKTRDQWCALLEGTDACFAPVLSLKEVPEHPHVKQREGFLTLGGVCQPAPAPRFSRTPGAVRSPPVAPGEGGPEALQDWGFTFEQVARLEEDGVLRRSTRNDGVDRR